MCWSCYVSYLTRKYYRCGNPIIILCFWYTDVPWFSLSKHSMFLLQRGFVSSVCYSWRQSIIWCTLTNIQHLRFMYAHLLSSGKRYKFQHKSSLDAFSFETSRKIRLHAVCSFSVCSKIRCTFRGINSCHQKSHRCSGVIKLVFQNQVKFSKYFICSPHCDDFVCSTVKSNLYFQFSPLIIW